jgi:hypothetical protein
VIDGMAEKVAYLDGKGAPLAQRGEYSPLFSTPAAKHLGLSQDNRHPERGQGLKLFQAKVSQTRAT